MGLIANALVGDGAGNDRHLQRCDSGFRLTNCGLQDVADGPFPAIFCIGFRIGESAGSVTRFNSGWTAQAVQLCIFGEVVNRQGFGKLIEIDVTGILQRLYDGNIPMRAGTVVSVSLVFIGMSAEISGRTSNNAFI